jgi:hypothetical protein
MGGHAPILEPDPQSVSDDEQISSPRAAENEDGRPQAIPGARLPDEPGAAWAAFVLFRSLGPKRSFSEVSRRLFQGRRGRKRGEKPVGRVRAWAARFSWGVRARAWDDHQDEVYRLASDERLKQMAERHIAVAVAAQEMIAARLLRLTDADVDRMSPEGLVYVFVQAARLERTARGMPTSVKKVAPEHRGDPELPFEPTLVVERDAEAGEGGSEGRWKA